MGIEGLEGFTLYTRDELVVNEAACCLAKKNL